jgi:DNA-binding NarL/FixJ family response regulator
MPSVKVVVVDDHELLRAGVRDLLASMPGYKLVGEAGTARVGLQLIESQKPDVVLMDVAMPGMDGIVATREILRRLPRARVIVLSAHKQIHDVTDALNAGAVGYVLKADPPETLMHALEHAARGESYVAPTLAITLAREATQSTPDILEILSEREREVFRLAADCRTSPEIARALCLARKTVDTHLNRINRKLGLRDRAELVRFAASIGLVHSLRSPSGSTALGDGVPPC